MWWRAFLLVAAGALASERRLSMTDHKIQRGRIEAARDVKRRRFVFIHIPKAAGASFMKKSGWLMPKGSTLQGSEELAAWSTVVRARLGRRGERVIFLRHPVQLIYSQFLYCKFSLMSKSSIFPKGDRKSTSSGLDEWIQRFSRCERGARKRDASKRPYIANSDLASDVHGRSLKVQNCGSAAGRPSALGCYHPWNVQFRFVAGQGGARSHIGVPPRITNKRARTMLTTDFAFVGLVDAYKESLCLFRWTNMPNETPPEYCACGTEAKFPKTPRTHDQSNYNSSLARITPDRRAALASLVPEDLLLYLEGLRVFEHTADRARAATNVTFICPAKLDALWAAALRDACATLPDKAAWITETFRPCPWLPL